MMISPLVYIIAPIFCGIIIYALKLDWMRYIVVPLQVLLVTAAFLGFITVGKDTMIVPLNIYPLPVGMSLRLDSFALLMVLLNNILFFVCTFFDLDEDYNQPLFIFLFISLQGLINGVFLSNDLFNIYIMIELASIIVSVLIMFKKDPAAMYNGMFYLMMSVFAMSFYLLGVGFVYKYFGVLDISYLTQLMAEVKETNALIIPFALLFTGVSLKAAIMPIFAWLPKAHATPSAPAVVTAIMSAIFVKIGLYLMLRMVELFSIVLNLELFLIVIGVVTAIAGAVLALSHNDIKLILAYHTISQVGLIIFVYAVGSKLGAIYHIFTHGIFKALLFLLASEMITIYQTRDIRNMHGLFKQSKRISICLVFAILSITGAPFFSGGLSKLLMIQTLSNDFYLVLIYLFNLLTMLSFMKFIACLSGEVSNLSNRELHVSEWLALYTLTVLTVLAGIPNNFIIIILNKGNNIFNFQNYLPTTLLYITIVIVAVLIYKKTNIVQRLKTFSRFDLSFNNALLSIVIYFIAIINYLILT